MRIELYLRLYGILYFMHFIFVKRVNKAEHFIFVSYARKLFQEHNHQWLRSNGSRIISLDYKYRGVTVMFQLSTKLKDKYPNFEV